MKKNTSKYHIIFFSSLELNEFEAVVERVVWCLCYFTKEDSIRYTGDSIYEQSNNYMYV
jgi:hypothetical protein